MTSMMIGVLEAGRPPEGLETRHGDYPAMVARLLGGRGFSFRSWAVLDGEIPAAPAEADGWVITGSRHGAYDPLPWIPPLEDFIRRAFAERVPMAGICFGHQIMAQALGGRVEKYEGGWGLGPARYEIAGIGTLTLNAVHQDQVVALPPGAVSEGGSEFCRHGVISFAPHAWSIQPHPEFEADFLADLIAAREGIFPEDRAAEALTRLATPLDNARVAEKIASVLTGQPSLAATASSASP